MTDTPNHNTKQPNPPCFIPLSLSPQSGKERVLYYNANAPLEDIFKCAIARLQAVIDLLENLYELDQTKSSNICTTSAVSIFLLSDAMTLLQEFNPVANRLKKSK